MPCELLTSSRLVLLVYLCLAQSWFSGWCFSTSSTDLDRAAGASGSSVRGTAVRQWQEGDHTWSLPAGAPSMQPAPGAPEEAPKSSRSSSSSSSSLLPGLVVPTHAAAPVFQEELSLALPAKNARRSPAAAYRRFLAEGPGLPSELPLGPGAALAPAPSQPAYLLVVMEVHGSNIQPFGYQDRVDFMVALDDAIIDIDLSNIELLAVEEFLPASGPSAESLVNLYGNSAISKADRANIRDAPSPAGMLCHCGCCSPLSRGSRYIK